jgi:hypothetical protein
LASARCSSSGTVSSAASGTGSRSTTRQQSSLGARPISPFSALRAAPSSARALQHVEVRLRGGGLLQRQFEAADIARRVEALRRSALPTTDTEDSGSSPARRSSG